MFSPVLAWNAGHGWASFAFQASRATGGVRFRPDALAGAVLGPAAYLMPWVWLLLLATLGSHLRAWRAGRATDAEKFLLCESAFPLATFLAVACVRPVLPHWTLIGYVGLMPLLGRSWAALAEARPVAARRRVVVMAALPVLFAAVYLSWYRTGLLQKEGRGLVPIVAAESDPTLDMYGWNQVADELARRGLVGKPGTFFFTSKWYYSGHLAFALGNAAPVLCYNATAPHGFSEWSRPEDWVGRDGILVSINRSSTEPGVYGKWFERIEPLGEFQVTRAGAAVRRVRLFRCVRQTRPFPFGPPAPEARVASTAGASGARPAR